MPARLKPEGMRQRKNKASTRALLVVTGDDLVTGTPRLPTCPNEGGWHKYARTWWAAVWSSPMAGEFLESDVPALVRLAVLIDAFWKNPSDVKLAAEIRQMEQGLGLAPLARRRLEWSIAKAEDGKEQHEQRRQEQAQVVDVDPRSLLTEG